MADNKRIYNTEIINRLLQDAASGLEIDTGAFYLGDLELRNNNIVFEYTDEEIEEFQRCAADPVYFIKNYCKFQTDLGRKLVKLYPFQEDMIRTICNEHYDPDVGEMVPDNRNCVTMASRQVGKCNLIDSQLVTNTGVKTFGDLYNDNSYISKFKGYLYKLYKNKSLKIYIGKFIELIEKIELYNYSLDENDVTKKILDTKELNSVEVLTDTGFEKATHIHKTQPYTVYILELENGYTLECADNHIIFDENYNEVFVKNLRINQKVLTDNGVSSVVKLQKMPYKLCMYDITIDSPNHRFYSNGILSHNTTTISSIFAWYLCFNVDKNVIVLANKDATSKEIVDKIIQIFRGLPFWLKPGAVNFGKTGLTLDNGCRLLSSATTASTSIGFTIHKLYLDEFAHIPAGIIEPFWRSVYPTMASSKLSQCIITSTPNGTGNLFYDIYSKSSNGTGENSFKAIRVDYWQVPGHDDKWAEAMKRDFGAELFAQEFGLQFNTSSKMLLKASDMQFMDKIRRKYSYRYLENINPLFADRRMVWHPKFDPKNISPKDRFVFSIDIAEGNENNDIKDEKKKSDYNIINIFKVIPNSVANIKSKNRNQKTDITDCVKFVQVGLFRDNINDEEYCANMTSALLYDIFDVTINDNVRLLVEMNFQGKNYVTHLKKDSRYFDSIIIKTAHSAPVPGERIKKKLGYKTTANKNFYCKKGADLIAKRRVIVNENESINQLGAFGEIKGKTLGGFACHDDISVTVVNAIPRMIAEESSHEFFEDLINEMEDQNHKFAINNIIQKWEMENPEVSDSAFNALYGNNDMENPYNALNMYNSFNSSTSYSQVMNKYHY